MIYPKVYQNKTIGRLLILTIFITVFLFVSPAQAADCSTVDASNELEVLLCKPQPRIKIPGLTFTQTSEMDDAVEVDGETTFINSPYLSEYIAAIYRYSVAAASILAILMIIISGLQWMIGGEEEGINAAKKRIIGSVTGLIIALSSYVILYTINPELVQFRNLRIEYIEYIPTPDFGPGSAWDGYSASSGVVNCGGQTMPESEILNIIQQEATRQGISGALAAAILKVETGFRSCLISSTGCSGIGQICTTSVPNPPIEVFCIQERSLGPRQCDLDRPLSRSGQYEPCTNTSTNCADDQRFDFAKGSVGAIGIVRSKFRSVVGYGCTGSNDFMVKITALSYNAGERWIDRASDRDAVGSCHNNYSDLHAWILEHYTRGTEQTPDEREKIERKSDTDPNSYVSRIVSYYNQYVAAGLSPISL